MKRISSVVQKAYSSDPSIWATWLLILRTLSKLRDIAYAWMLNAPGLHIGPRSAIRGVRCISFGRGIYVSGGLWLEALNTYREQRFSPRIVIGDGVSFSEGVHISCVGQIVIGRRTLMGSRVYISDHNHGAYKGQPQSLPDEPPSHRQLTGGPVTIGEDVWIGDNAVIVGPVTIGDGAVVGANSVVKNDVPPRTVVAGIPARAIKRFDPLSERWEKI